MVKNEKLNVDLQMRPDGSPYIAAHTCGNCGTVRSVQSFTSLSKKSFVARSLCTNCDHIIITCFGDQKTVDEFFDDIDDFASGLKF